MLLLLTQHDEAAAVAAWQAHGTCHALCTVNFKGLLPKILLMASASAAA
jgi:hypothetical protein